METTIRKSYHGRIIESIIKLGDNRELQFSTMKRCSGNCSTHVQTQSRLSKGVVQTSPFDELNEHILSKKIRCTKKQMLALHNESINIFKESDMYKSLMESNNEIR